MATIILRLTEVKRRTGFSRSTIHLRMGEGKFPVSISLGGRAIGWVEAEVDEWISRRIRREPQLFKFGGRCSDMAPLCAESAPWHDWIREEMRP
jgi:prophage regulatory protein